MMDSSDEHKGVVSKGSYVDQVVERVEDSIVLGEVERDSVGMVVACYQAALSVMPASALISPVRRVVRTAALSICKTGALVRNLREVMYALEMAAASDKRAFSIENIIPFRESPVDVVLESMQMVQKAVEQARESGQIMTREQKHALFLRFMLSFSLTSIVQEEVSELVEHGLVEEVVGMLRTDEGLSKSMVDRLHLAAHRVVVRSTKKCLLWCC
jgi:hypothetical protein